MEVDLPHRWQSLHNLFSRTSSIGNPHFEPSIINAEKQLALPILVIGAGGLGCELLKDLSLMGFKDIHVIDMDTIDLSNLNRQFLFRNKDIGQPKATVAAEFINNRVNGVHVTPHYGRIEDKDDIFYKQFSIVVCGLDSVQARRWINAKLVELVETRNQEIVASSIIPMVDGGTEGFKGHVKVIVPKMGPCFECLLPLFPPKEKFAMCTIQSTPRLPEHCIAYAKILQWDRDKPFLDKLGKPSSIDTDNFEHMTWLYEAALERSKEFNITGVTFKLTQGVVKNIIPAIASTNAIISALVSAEAFKFVTEVADNLDNFFMNNGTVGNYSLTVSHEKIECLVCGTTTSSLSVANSTTVQEFVTILTENERFQLKSPAISRNEGAPIYFPKTDKDKLGLQLSSIIPSSSILLITDPTYPSPLLLQVIFSE